MRSNLSPLYYYYFSLIAIIGLEVAEANTTTTASPSLLIKEIDTYVNAEENNTSTPLREALRDIDPYGNTSTPLREAIHNKHVGVTVTIQILDFQDDFMSLKNENFERLTGATINKVKSSQATWYDDVLGDIKNHETGFIDLYASFGNWIPHFAELGGLMDISSDIDSVGLDWFDIMPGVRTGVATYKQKVYAVPLDGDVILMLYRKDLVEDVGLPTPHSWDDVLEILDYYKDKDINGDGIPDYGNCFSTAENDIADKMFWAIASSFLQTKGTSQGTFFDPETMKPTSSTAKFLTVLAIYKVLVSHSPFRDNNDGVNWIQNLEEFSNGRCVLWYNYPGPTRQLISNQGQNNMTGVLNLAPLPGYKCEADESCPHATENGTNHAPFLASGGMAYAVNSRISPEKQSAALDFAFYLSDPAVSFWDVANPNSFLDPLRQRHTASLANIKTKESESFLSFGWEPRQLPMLKRVTEFNFLHKNDVLDLRVLGAEDYQGKGTVPHLIKMWDGTNDAQTTANEITKSWEAVTLQYGLEEQRAMYRDILNLPEYEEELQKFDIRLIIALSLAFGSIIIILFIVVMKQRHTIKFKTRDVNSAPKSGTIALIFTDIEGSTSLWDGSKSAMSKALVIHHNVVRKCIERHKAYEVKTIGDAFMIACDNADKAVLISNDIQLDLLNANWPMELAELPAACVYYFPREGNADPKAMFKGVRVRIGVHLGTYSKEVELGGEVQIMYDEITKGYDYYGPTANTAARIESVGFGGQTVISADVHNQLSLEAKKLCTISKIGKMALRGVSEEVFLYVCLPKQLGRRKFQGIVRRKNSLGCSLRASFIAEAAKSPLDAVEIDKGVDVMTLTPIELQDSLRRMQNAVAFLEKEVVEMKVATIKSPRRNSNWT